MAADADKVRRNQRFTEHMAGDVSRDGIAASESRDAGAASDPS
jgi:hypothetical protein